MRVSTGASQLRDARRNTASTRPIDLAVSATG